MSRTCLVIGGTRNLGPDLVAALLQRGDRVTVLNRGVTPDDLPADVERLRADRSDAAALRTALGSHSWDLVVDTSLYNGPDARAIADLLGGRAGRYVFLSTGQVYLVRLGLRPPFAERDYAGPVMAEPAASSTQDHESWAYGVDKRAAEDALRQAFETGGFPYLSLRMPMITSRRDHYGRLASYVHRLLDGGPILIPDDQHLLGLRHVSGDDVVRAILLAGADTVPPGSCVNIAQDDTLTLEAALAVVGRTLSVTPRLAALPREQLESIGLLPACSPWSGRWMSQPDNAASKDLLGMTYQSAGVYLPALADAARAVPAAQVPGYARRGEELRMAGA